MRALPQYEHAVREAGGEPVIIDVNAASNAIAQKAKTCDGVLLPGSPADVDPEKYGAQRHAKTAACRSACATTPTSFLLQDAYNMRKPIFGICYGLQSLNVWRTGTLVQHLETGVDHDPGRTVVAKRTRWRSIPSRSWRRFLRSAGVSRQGEAHGLTVNSSHHQAVRVLGDGLRLAAWSPERRCEGGGRRNGGRSFRSVSCSGIRSAPMTATRRRAPCFRPSSRPPPSGTRNWPRSRRTLSRWRNSN